MQKKGIVISLFFSGMLFCSDYSSIALSDFSARVHRRYYYIERLKRTIQLLSRVKEQLNQVGFLVRRMTRGTRYQYIFKHPRIRDSVNEIIRTRSLKPLLKIWDEFTAYKSLESDLFIDEFTQEIFIITKSVLLQHMIVSKALCGDIFACEIKLALSNDIEDRLEQISAMTDQLHDDYGSYAGKAWLNRTDDLYDVISDVSSEAVLQRFYHIRRLAEHKGLLLQPEFRILLHVIDAHKHGTTAPLATFNVDLRTALSDILHEKNPQLLGKMIEDFEQFKALGNQQQVVELAKTIFVVYWYLLLPIQARNITYRVANKGEIVAEILDAYNQIDQLPLEELLDSIDKAAKILKQVLQGKTNEVSLHSMLFTGSWWSRATALFSLLYKLGWSHYHS